MNSYHQPVLLAEAVASLNIRAGGVYVDGTVGGGGHAREILRLSEPGGILVGIDLDQDSLKTAREALSQFGNRVKLVHGNYSAMGEILKSLGIGQVDGILLDLGVSSHQLNEGARGFSFTHDGPLDMRLNQQSPIDAYTIVNQASEEKLREIISTFGEEVMAGRIAEAIVARRSQAPITTTGELAELIVKALPGKRRAAKIHPATKTFQALRIAVNGELDHLSSFLASALDLLLPQGRLSIISFHSLEDRLVKRRFHSWALTCHCPPRSPVCLCQGQAAKVRLLSRRPVLPSPQEIKINPRARSARLRTVERI